MSANKQLVAFATAFAVLAASVSGAAAETTAHRQHYMNRPQYPPVRVATANGWRHRTVRGWDNTCIDVPWLANMWACGAK